MTQQEINQRNEAIALFMGRRSVYSLELYRKETEQHVLVTSDKLCYHSDWNWLMPVVDKIEEINLDIPRKKWVNGKQPDIYRVDIINRNMCEILKNGEESVAFAGEDSKIDAVFLAISDFCMQYNQLTPSTDGR